MPARRGMYRCHWNPRRKAGGHCRLPPSFTREDPVVSQLQDQNSRPGTIRANLFRSRSSTLRLWVLFLTLTCLATLAQASASFSKSRLCRVRRRFPGSEALRCNQFLRNRFSNCLQTKHIWLKHVSKSPLKFPLGNGGLNRHSWNLNSWFSILEYSHSTDEMVVDI